jgi:hypothetical protein
VEQLVADGLEHLRRVTWNEDLDFADRLGLERRGGEGR